MCNTIRLSTALPVNVRHGLECLAKLKEGDYLAVTNVKKLFTVIISERL
jgi:hypothetical protein